MSLRYPGHILESATVLHLCLEADEDKCSTSATDVVTNFSLKSSDADILVGPAEIRRLKSKRQDGNELHERKKWCKACSVSVSTSVLAVRADK